MFGPYSAPAECMAYTGVFQSVKIESALCFIAGVLMGLFIYYYRDR